LRERAKSGLIGDIIEKKERKNNKKRIIISAKESENHL